LKKPFLFVAELEEYDSCDAAVNGDHQGVTNEPAVINFRGLVIQKRLCFLVVIIH
jgi:hypothetical protein